MALKDNKIRRVHTVMFITYTIARSMNIVSLLLGIMKEKLINFNSYISKTKQFRQKR